MTTENQDLFPIHFSKSGKNAYVFPCAVTQTRMNYAACLARLDSIDAGKMQKDHAACEKARNCKECEAAKMRHEEIVEGRSIYYVARSAIAAAVETARKWIDIWNKPDPVRHEPGPAKTPKPAKVGSTLDALGAIGSYADAITAAATEPARHYDELPGGMAEKPAPVAPKTLPATRSGETPLEMARRLAAQRKAT